MKQFLLHATALFCAGGLQAAVVFDQTSAYHHIRVVDDTGVRMLRFNDSQETKMSLLNPLQGHFEYTEYFHTPWIWNHDMKRVVIMGLGGGSTQRSYQHYYTNVLVETVEIDPVVVSVAKKFFQVTETPKHQIHTEDGRVFLRRSTNRYDAILMDAYATTRYGSSIPPHLATKEFFALANEHLTTNGVMAYNVIGQIQGWREDFVGALYRTMKEVFPHVYLFPAVESQNIVFVGTKSTEQFDLARVQKEGATLARAKVVTLPTFSIRLRSFWNAPPPNTAKSPVLTDDYAPVESLLRGGGSSR